MKFKKFLLSCSPSVHRKRLEDSSISESRYVNLRPISKRTSVPDFQVQNGNHGAASSSSSSSTTKAKLDGHRPKNKVEMKHSRSTSNFYVNYGNENARPSESNLNFDLPSSSGAQLPVVASPETYEGDEGVKKGDRVVWAREETGRTERGVVKWLGDIKGEVIAGIEFDNPLGLGSGWYENRQLFQCERHHGGLVAVAGLILEQDYFSVSPGPGPSKRTSVAPSESSASLFYPPSQRSSSRVVPAAYANPELSGSANSVLPPTTAAPQPIPSIQVPCDAVVQSLSGLGLDRNFTMAPRAYVQEPLKEEDAERFNGRMKGIQGNRNSCYLDATLFSMFSFSSVFDSILLQNYEPQQQVARDLQRILRDEIVNPLRKELFCPAQNVMKLRETMVHLDDKLTTAEMDPAEFLQTLFKQVLELNEFIKLSSNESDFFHQVLVHASEKDRSEVPTIQRLFEQSLMMQQLKLKAIPSPALILQMPRSGNKYKMYSGIFPNLTIDITDLVENTPRTCIVCGELATVECPECYDRFTSNNREDKFSQGIPFLGGAESTAFCETCIDKTHRRNEALVAHRQRFTRIEYSFDTSKYFFPSSQPLISFSNGDNFPVMPTHSASTTSVSPNRISTRGIPRITLDLIAVICIETSHFVSFVKCGTDRKAPWAFFDSMADRVENTNGSGHNIPQVKLLPAFGTWLDQLEREQETLKNSMDSLTPEMKRFLADPYICIYYSPQMSMYR